MKKLNIVIAGYNIAGIAALFLYKQGYTVILFERAKSLKVLGSGFILQPTGLNILTEPADRAHALSIWSNLEDALETYARTRYLYRRIYQMINRIFTPFYQSHNPVLPVIRDHLFRPISQFNPIARILAHLVSGSLLPPQW